MNINDIYTEGLRDPKDNPCWKGYHPVGTKKKDGRTVPNCVPNANEGVAEGSEEQVYKVLAVDKSNALSKQVKLKVKASSLDEVFERLAINDWYPLEINGVEVIAGKRLKQGVAEEYNAEYDDEAGMADNNLATLERAVEGIDELIGTGDNLPEWCQEKIAVAKSMLVAVWDYMKSEQESDEEPEIAEMYEAMDRLANKLAAINKVDADLVWESFESLPDYVLYETAQYQLRQLNEDWQKVNKRDKTDGMSRKAVKAYRRENPGSKLKTAVTTKPSKLKKGSKSAKRRKSFCARMSGMKKSRASAKTKRDPNSPINKALRRWNC